MEEETLGSFAGYFKGRVYVSNYLSVGMRSTSYPVDVNGTIRCQTLIQTSDERLKENIATLEDDIIYKLRQLKGVTYQFKQIQKAVIT